MKKYLIRVMAIFTFSFMFASCFSLAAEAKVLKMYAPYPADSFITQGLVSAVEQIKKETKGKISIKIFPGGQLGGYEEAVEEVRQGTIDLASTWLTKRFDPRLDMLNLPGYAPLGYKQLAKICFAVDSPFATKIESVLQSINIVSLGPWPEPYANLIFAKGKRPEKFIGFENKKRSIRVPGMPLYRDSYVAMGYQTLTMDVSELWNAMQTGQVDGASGQTLESTYLLGKDIVKHVDYNRAVCPPSWLIINKDLWSSFTKEQQKIVSKAFNTWSLKTLDLMAKKDIEYAKLLKDYGIEVAEYNDKYYSELAAYLRKTVWPKYYDVFGKDFLVNLDKIVNNMKNK
ncbi:MAG: TRAP transporter substrate-binding protein DctP [Cloacibacillus sp.]